MANRHSLRETAMLVTVKTKGFGLERLDREASAKVADMYGSEQVYSKVVKALLNPQNPLFKKIKTIRGLITNTNEALTGPWVDRGPRIITAKGFEAWKSTIDELEVMFFDAVNAWVAVLPQLKAEALKGAAGLYDPSLLPSDEVIRDAFTMTIEVDVIPDRSNSIILDMDDDRMARIINDATALQDRRIKDVTEHTERKVREKLENMVSALSKFGDVNKEAKRKGETFTFRNSLTEHIQGICDLLPALNITNDPKLERLQKELTKKLTKHDAPALRGDKLKGDKRTDTKREAEAAKAREATLADATKILDGLDGIFG